MGDGQKIFRFFRKKKVVKTKHEISTAIVQQWHRDYKDLDLTNKEQLHKAIVVLVHQLHKGGVKAKIVNGSVNETEDI